LFNEQIYPNEVIETTYFDKIKILDIISNTIEDDLLIDIFHIKTLMIYNILNPDYAPSLLKNHEFLQAPTLDCSFKMQVTDNILIPDLSMLI
jgi:hypothetical protein